MTPAAPRATGWSVPLVVALVAVFVLGIVIRVALWPTQGLRGDIDQFVVWAHGIALHSLPNAYDQNLSFGPVMAYVWGVLAAIEPAFRTATDAADPTIRVLMKVPASLADLGLAALVAFALRDRAVWAVTGAAVILLVPAVVDISAWWGQYESVYLLSALAAVILATRGHNSWAAALLAVSLMTKPQALPFLFPFAAWFWATGGARGFARAAIVGAVTIIALWIPFLSSGGPINYIHNLAEYQGTIFNILSLRAWNAWWLLQTAAGGAFIADDVAFLGPVSLRIVGYGIVAIFEVVIAIAVLRDPRPRSLILGLASSTLLAFGFLTSMHERYAYGALIFLLLLLPERRVRWLTIAFGVVFTANLLAATPPTPDIGAWFAIDGPTGVVGSIAMLAIAAASLWLLLNPGGAPDVPATPVASDPSPTPPGAPASAAG